MKTFLWMLVLLCLCVPGRGDCQKDCLFCSQLLSKDQAFSTLVCLVECHGKVVPGLTWEACRSAVEESRVPSLSMGGGVIKRADEEAADLLPLEQRDGGMLYPGALQRFDHVARALGLEKQPTQLSATFRSQQTAESEEDNQEVGDGSEGDNDAESDQGGAAVSLAKRFGGFLKGKYGYKKLMDPGRSFQKRYGGFIGVRKSARKWNNQKRFSEFLKQYLGMSTRASEYNSVSADITQQNEV
ncbi:prepronociceptin [Denticeps clupeoides]|uniref:Prepronociceptin n=1 Tax=Denticeps clupeoides TaxID=299321 RepID=A0AAY4A7J7_9TELE|nr:prepronociceptin [Denticeps clupeoides]XP_028846902.1 prepronociceptin [Denticeps clupeoides]